MTLLCEVDGVEVVEAKSGRMVHLDALPKGVDPDHEIKLVDPLAYGILRDQELDVHIVAGELLTHHLASHPLSDCPFGQRMAEALRARR